VKEFFLELGTNTPEPTSEWEAFCAAVTPDRAFKNTAPAFRKAEPLGSSIAPKPSEPLIDMEAAQRLREWER
jgi:hypothetical protein